jgi:hypothetical protein
MPVRFGLTLVFSTALGLATMDLTDFEWSWEAAVPFVVSLVGASEIYYRTFVDSIPGVKDWLSKHLVKDASGTC